MKIPENGLTSPIALTHSGFLHLPLSLSSAESLARSPMQLSRSLRVPHKQCTHQYWNIHRFISLQLVWHRYQWSCSSLCSNNHSPPHCFFPSRILTLHESNRRGSRNRSPLKHSLYPTSWLLGADLANAGWRNRWASCKAWTCTHCQSRCEGPVKRPHTHTHTHTRCTSLQQHRKYLNPTTSQKQKSTAFLWLLCADTLKHKHLRDAPPPWDWSVLSHLNTSTWEMPHLSVHSHGRLVLLRLPLPEQREVLLHLVLGHHASLPGLVGESPHHLPQGQQQRGETRGGGRGTVGERVRSTSRHVLLWIWFTQSSSSNSLSNNTEMLPSEVSKLASDFNQRAGRETGFVVIDLLLLPTW